MVVRRFETIRLELKKELEKRGEITADPDDIAQILTPLVVELCEEYFRDGRLDFANELHQLAERFFEDKE